MAETNSYEPGYFQLNSLSLGEVAALLYNARKVTREMQSINKVKIPHMLKENMKWIVRGAESQPVIKLSVQVSTKSYSENNIKPPSAYRHRQADLEMLADTGSQAVIMATNQLGQLGLKMKEVKKFLQSKSVISLAFIILFFSLITSRTDTKPA